MSAGKAATPTSRVIGQPVPLSAGRSLIIVLAAVFVAVVSAWTMLTSPHEVPFDHTPWWIYLAGNLFTVAVGVVAWHALPANRVGPLLVVLGLVSFINWLTHTEDGVLWMLGDTWVLAGTVVTFHIFLAYPEGRTSGWSRALVLAIYAWWITFSLISMGIRELPTTYGFSNPFAVWPNQPLLDTLSLIGFTGGLVLIALVVAVVVQKWRHGSPLARRALAPVIWILPITVLAVGEWIAGRLPGLEREYAWVGLLFGLALGILVIVAAIRGWRRGASLAESTSEPLFWAAPIVALLLTDWLIVEFARTDDTSVWLVNLNITVRQFLLPSAFLVGLLRIQLSRTSIGGLIRELDDGATSGLEETIARAVHDPTLQLAFPTNSGAYVDTEGRMIELPTSDPDRSITRIGPPVDPLAILVHDVSADPELVSSAAAASRLALDNARLTAELRAQLAAVEASRLRIVEATDQERRRIERDLHDGAQQRLVALGFALRDAKRRAADDDELSQTLDRAQGELEDGLRDLRAIARGLHPSALDDGLSQAIHELADRSPVPVDVQVELPPATSTVESTVYYVVAEAVTNALRHAEAERIEVRAFARDSRLVIEIMDDGRGGADETASGSGMRGLSDRVLALGGTLTVESPEGAGTRVVATLPQS